MEQGAVFGKGKWNLNNQLRIKPSRDFPKASGVCSHCFPLQAVQITCSIPAPKDIIALPVPLPQCPVPLALMGAAVLQSSYRNAILALLALSTTFLRKLDVSLVAVPQHPRQVSYVLSKWDNIVESWRCGIFSG